MVTAHPNLFDRFGGTRPMAKLLAFPPSTIDNWKRARRVPSQHHPLIIRRAAELDIPVTAEDVVFPFPEDRVASR